MTTTETTQELTEQEKQDLLNKYCRLNSRMTYPDAEDILKDQGPAYIKKRIKKLEKRQARPKKVVDKAALIKGIATSYYLNDKTEMLDRIMQDLKYLGFVDVSCSAQKSEEEDSQPSTYKMTFFGRHADPEIQAAFVESPRTDLLFQYKFAYGQLLCVPFGSLGQKEAYCKDLRKLHDLAYKIVGHGSQDHPSYIMKTHNITSQEQGLRDFYHWTVIWQAPDVKLEQERKAADELKAHKQQAVSSAASKLDKAADLIRDYLIEAMAYQFHYGEEMPTITEKAVCWKESIPQVVLVATGENVPRIEVSYPKGKEYPHEETEEEDETDDESLEDLQKDPSPAEES